MRVRLHPHARTRARERGTSAAEVVLTVRLGTPSRAKFGRTLFARTFAYNRTWFGKRYARKRVQAFAAPQKDGGWLVVTVIVKFF